MVSRLEANGTDLASISEERSIGGGAYKTISKTDFQYDEQGNETQGKVYPSYNTDGEKEVIQNDYTYNSLGQQIKKTVTITSAERPIDNRTYIKEEVSYDSFGNELTYTDENGLVSKTTYDLDKDEAAGTWTESVYEYGSEVGDDGDEENPDEEKEEVSRLLEERTYPFEPNEKHLKQKKQNIRWGILCCIM